MVLVLPINVRHWISAHGGSIGQSVTISVIRAILHAYIADCHRLQVGILHWTYNALANTGATSQWYSICKLADPEQRRLWVWHIGIHLTPTQFIKGRIESIPQQLFLKYRNPFMDANKILWDWNKASEYNIKPAYLKLILWDFHCKQQTDLHGNFSTEIPHNAGDKKDKYTSRSDIILENYYTHQPNHILYM